MTSVCGALAGVCCGFEELLLLECLPPPRCHRWVTNSHLRLTHVPKKRREVQLVCYERVSQTNWPLVVSHRLTQAKLARVVTSVTARKTSAVGVAVGGRPSTVPRSTQSLLPPLPLPGPPPPPVGLAGAAPGGEEGLLRRLGEEGLDISKLRAPPNEVLRPSAPGSATEVQTKKRTPLVCGR